MSRVTKMQKLNRERRRAREDRRGPLRTYLCVRAEVVRRDEGMFLAHRAEIVREICRMFSVDAAALHRRSP